MPGRNASSGDYRYGFNGQEMDNEINGVTGSKLDFGARIYDSRLGTWLSMDPLRELYPGESPYIFAGDNPIYFLDKGGETKTTYITTIENGEKTTVKVETEGTVPGIYYVGIKIGLWYFYDKAGKIVSEKDFGVK